MDQRKALWDDLSKLKPQGPRCLAGDFNNVLFTQDRIGGKRVIEAEFKDLKEFMDKNDLAEMRGCGDYYTWSNKHQVGTIYSRIDRILGNTSWFQANMNSSLEILPPNVSDHALLFLYDHHKSTKKHKRFRFLNYLTD